MKKVGSRQSGTEFLGLKPKLGSKYTEDFLPDLEPILGSRGFEPPTTGCLKRRKRATVLNTAI